jgi:hypothetical protein
MNTITNSQTNNNINKYSNSTISKEKMEFCNKLEKLKDALKERDNNNEYQQHEFKFQSYSLDKLLLSSYDKEPTEDEQLPLHIPLYQLHDTPQICPNIVSEIPNTISTTVVQSLQEITNYIDNHCLMTQTQSTSMQKIWNFSYTDNMGINIEFQLKKASNESFNLSCNITSNILKKYINDLNDRLTKKGWSLISNNSNINFKIIKTTND